MSELDTYTPQDLKVAAEQLRRELGRRTAPHDLLLDYVLKRVMQLAVLGESWPPVQVPAPRGGLTPTEHNRRVVLTAPTGDAS